jgi:hypothetical protein
MHLPLPSWEDEESDFAEPPAEGTTDTLERER